MIVKRMKYGMKNVDPKIDINIGGNFFKRAQFSSNLELKVKYRCSKVPCGHVSTACRCPSFRGTESAKRGAFCFAAKANQEEMCILSPSPTEWESQRGTAREEDRNAAWSEAVQ